MSDSVYKVIELVGSSADSWEKAAKNAVETAGASLKNLRVAEVGKLDMKVRGRQGRRVPCQSQSVLQVRILSVLRRGSSRTCLRMALMVKIEVRLFATLRQCLPLGSGRSAASLEVPVGMTIAALIAQLGIPAQAAALVLVAGVYEADRERQLADGDVLSVFPNVAGG